jgi:hypothetical protein
MQEEQDEKGHGDDDDRGNLLPVWKDRAGRRNRAESGRQHHHDMIFWEQHFSEVRRVNGDKEDLYPFKHQLHVGDLFNIDLDTAGNLGLLEAISR